MLTQHNERRRNEAATPHQAAPPRAELRRYLQSMDVYRLELLLQH